MTIPCHIITLEPEGARIYALGKAFKEQGIEVAVFHAVDGRNSMPDLQPGEQIDQDAAVRRRKAPLNTSEVGCYLSHLRLIHQAYAEGIDRIAVFEDDIDLKDGFKEVLEAVESLPDSVEFLRLMGMRQRKRKMICNLPDDHQLVRPIRGWQGTQGYVLNRSGMKKVIRQGSVLSLPIDIFYDTFWETDLLCFGVEPHVISEKNHVSSIRKPKETGVDRSLPTIIRWRIGKLVKSMRRLSYLALHASDFFPVSKPVTSGDLTMNGFSEKGASQ